MWVVISLCPLCVKLSLLLPSTKYLLIYEKYTHILMGSEALDCMSLHKKYSLTPISRLLSKWKSPPATRS